MTTAIGTPNRNTEWSERTKDSSTPCWTSGGKACSCAGLMEKLPLTWIEWAAAPGTSTGIQWLSPAMNTAPNSEVPNAPPSERKNVTAAVAVPIWVAGTAVLRWRAP